MSIQQWSGLMAGLYLMMCLGCSDGPKKYEVAGTISIDGKTPPEGSSITFIPADGKSSTEGCTVSAGKYSAKVSPGQYKVEIRAPRITGKANAQPKGGYQTQGEIIEEMLPPKFNDSTELTFEVKAQKNEKNWDLQTK